MQKVNITNNLLYFFLCTSVHPQISKSHVKMSSAYKNYLIVNHYNVVHVFSSSLPHSHHAFSFSFNRDYVRWNAYELVQASQWGRSRITQDQRTNILHAVCIINESKEKSKPTEHGIRKMDLVYWFTLHFIVHKLYVTTLKLPLLKIKV